MFRGDFEFHDDAVPSHLAMAGLPPPTSRTHRPNSCELLRCGDPCPGHCRCTLPAANDDQPSWTSDAERELRKIPSSSAERRGATPNLRQPRTGSIRSPSRHCTMQKHTSGANAAPVNVVLITLDNHMSAAVDDARRMLLADELPNLHLSVHAATDWNDNPDKLQACKDDIAKGDIIVATMLFMEDHVKAMRPGLAGPPRSLRRHDLLHVRPARS
jgi:hypothetical protein